MAEPAARAPSDARRTESDESVATEKATAPTAARHAVPSHLVGDSATGGVESPSAPTGLAGKRPLAAAPGEEPPAKRPATAATTPATEPGKAGGATKATGLKWDPKQASMLGFFTKKAAPTTATSS